MRINIVIRITNSEAVHIWVRTREISFNQGFEADVRFNKKWTELVNYDVFRCTRMYKPVNL